MNDSQNNNVEPLKDRLIRIGDGDAEFIQQLIVIFSKNAKKAQDELNESSLSISIFEKQQIAHKLKSNFQLFEYVEAASIASIIEHSNSHEEMQPHIEKINEILPSILNEIMKVKI